MYSLHVQFIQWKPTIYIKMETHKNKSKQIVGFSVLGPNLH